MQDVFLYFIERRDELQEVPTLGYVLTATRHQAYAWLRPIVRQRTLAMDPADLVHLEAMLYALEHGRPHTPEVTFAEQLPEPVA